MTVFDRFKNRKSARKTGESRRQSGSVSNCSRCGVSLRLLDKTEVFYYNGKPYCDACFSKLNMKKVICVSCGGFFSKEDVTVREGKHYCADCLKIGKVQEDNN